MKNNSSTDFARCIRLEAVKMVARANASHIGGALSMADIIAVLYNNILRVDPGFPNWPERDRFILSKGHACTALYAALALKNFFPLSELDTYARDGSRLMSHVSHKVPGVEFSTGSLGHGLPFACGKALSAKRCGQNWRVFALLSDGELDEGSNWEAILFAPHHALDNLVLIIDYNKVQALGDIASVLNLAPLAEKFRAFNWNVREVDGHDHAALIEAFSTLPRQPGKPSCLIANTVKGKGVNFMENQLYWHYSSPKGKDLASALLQLEKQS